MTTSSEEHRRVLWGVAVTAQTVALLVSVLAVGALIGLAVLNWLEQFA